MPGGRVAIVGGGIAGFVGYLTLLYGRVHAEEITVFATTPDPADAWRRRAAAIRQRTMRSESDGHCLPLSFPGLAFRAARREGLVPLALSVCNRFHPTVTDFLEHVQEQRERSGWDGRVRLVRAARVMAVEGGFSVEGEVFQHVLLAPGHPAHALPAELAGDARVVHAYEPHEYADDVAVVGAGMAAATEWLNALAAGARVTSVRRREPVRRPLNVPRSLFSRRGLAGFHETGPARRRELLEDLLAPSYPPGSEWDRPVERAAAEQRFRVRPELDGETQVICATGFVRGYEHDPVLAALVADHDLDTEGRWIVLAPDCTVAALTDRSRTLSLAGVAAQWAYPAADTIVGAKYAARAFLRQVTECPTP